MGVFDDIYYENGWENSESVSGNGSSLDATVAIRAALPDLFTKYDLHRILDVPCGDYNWLRHTTFNHWVAILGMDIVPELIEKNKNLYGEYGEFPSSTEFVVGDICRHKLPAADVVLVRDLLGHLPNWKIQLALRNIKSSGSKYLLATTFPEHHATDDGAEGAWRPINLAEYWGLGEPIEYINEQCDVPGFEDKALGLWRLIK